MRHLGIQTSRGRLIAVVLLLTWLPAGVSPAQDNSATKSAGPQDIVAFLNQTILWYRDLTAQQQLANEPNDVIFLNDNRQLADQVVRLSFEFARAEAQALSASAGQGSSEAQRAAQGSTPSGSYQSLTAIAGRMDAQLKRTQAELQSQNRQLDAATGRKRVALESAIAETESEISLLQARRDAVRGMLEFVSGATAGTSGGGSLQAQIDELARTVPAAALETAKSGGAPQEAPGSAATSVATAGTSRKAEPSGILAIASNLIELRRKVHALDEAIQRTDALTQSARALRAPLGAHLKSLVQRGDQLANQPDSQDPAVLAQQKKDIDSLTAQFKQISAIVFPLRKQSVLLDLYKRSLANWRNSVQAQYSVQFKSLGLRLGALAIVLAAVLGISEVWRRATFRYIHDARRRYQFLLLRRFVVWAIMAVVIAVSFASELGSLATFAGLLTAGIAVALQNVILSVAGYFFLIGKYGVRVGDRVQIAGVTGDVVDIGLVRIHLVEVSNGGSDARPSGRAVVFSNAVVFQANAGLFKQIPGTNFLWHEITLTLAPDTDYRQVEERMLGAVQKVFNHYRENMELQRRTMERVISPISVASLRPESRLRLTQGGIEVIMRYPVELSRAGEIDDRVARELLDEIHRAPRLRLVGSAVPHIEAIAETHDEAAPVH
ncbi:MAG TPA: mechanosensitive ion channel domain-containing protein [Terriglobales bacterium]|nr:mechanosensitive ion channel domain-containing protein [Terriglobales bacterium]